MTTTREPVCPAWCDVPAKAHAAEAARPISSWYYHAYVPLDDEIGCVTLSVCQTFEEQAREGDAPDVPTISVEVNKDELTQAETLALAGAIVRAAACMAAAGWTPLGQGSAP